MADLLLSLYVGDQDAIVSGDRLIKSAFATVDPAISVVSAMEIN